MPVAFPSGLCLRDRRETEHSGGASCREDARTAGEKPLQMARKAALSQAAADGDFPALSAADIQGPSSVHVFLDDRSIFCYTATMTRASVSRSTRQNLLDTGRKLVTQGGFGAMGLSTLLKESGVPKGSFYHYFASKEAFGEAMLRDYIEDYLARIDTILERNATGARKLEAFFAAWLDHERDAGMVNTCLVVNLGAEVADLSEGMRKVMNDGVVALVGMIAAMMREGVADGSLDLDDSPDNAARVLYAQLLGAAILSKLSRDLGPLEIVVNDTRMRRFTGAWIDK